VSAPEVERLRAQQRAVSEVLRAVARSEGLQPVLDEIVEAATDLCDGDNGRLFLLQDDLLHATANHGLAEEYEWDRQHPHVIDRTTFAGRAALERAPVHVPDIRDDPEYSYAGPAPYRAGLAVPILAEDGLIGVVVIVRMEPKPFAEEHIDLVRTFADQAAIAIANARLLDAVERQLEQQRAISDVLRSVARLEGLQPVLDEIVERATRLCAGHNGRLWLLKDGLLHAVSNLGGNDDAYQYDKQHPHPVTKATMAGRAALARAPVHIPDIEADPEYAYAGPRAYRSALSVPILLEDELIGVIGVVREAPDPFADEHIELVSTFADQAAIAIANARLVERVERQRTELARFVSPQVAELLSSEDGERLLAGHRAYVSVLFCDLRGFTAFTETAAPEELFDVLGNYHALVGGLIAHVGTLEHFAGDGVMVFFNDPVPLLEHEATAIRVAIALQEGFEKLATTWRKRGNALGLGIGIAAGYATLGRIGFEGRYDYGALGPVTNLASRLSTHAQSGQILVDPHVFAATESTFEVEPVGELELKGFGRPVTAYEVRRLAT
jgi:class 3 adenylate cyclase/putative methionine-R-sulfoxide reductase with GAF domain